MTTLRYGRIFAASTAAALAVVVAGTQTASSQTLMDLLFRDRQRAAQPQVQTPAAPVVREVPRVKGPQYYTYKTDPLVRVDFAAIVPHRAKDGAEATGQGVDHSTVGTTLEERIEAVVQEPPAVSAEEEGEVQAAAPEPAAQQSLSDDQIASLQQFELLAEKQIAEALVAHYSAEPHFLWVEGDAITSKARAALDRLADAESHGLDPRDYAIAAPAENPDENTLAAFEMELSARLLRYAKDARSGRIDPNRISGYHDFKAKAFDAQQVLAEARDNADIAAFLEAQHPQNSSYKALRNELARLRASAENDIVVAQGTVIKPGETSSEFSKILTLIDRKADEAFRTGHGEVLARHLGTQTYVQELAPVIKAAQRLAGVGDDGVIGPRTVQALAGETRAAAIEKVLVALEQLRWLPSDLGERHVFINSPAFEATYMEDGEEKLSMRTVVGSLGTQTYFFQDEISYVEFHPYWGMPRSILVNSYLPRVLKDPSYFDRNGYEVIDRRGQKVSSTAIDWTAYGSNIPFDVRQRPGPNNALGEMKIMFPNEHAIYMHDTPDRHLFERENRALSNGCIRLADPRAMAAAVLGWDREQVANRLKGQHGRENLSTKVPVYVAYFTAWPDQTGEVHYYNDVYSRDEKVRAAIEKVEALRAPAG